MNSISNTSKVTIKGTTTIPVSVRKELGINSGSFVSFQRNNKTGDIVIKKIPTLKELHKQNAQYLKGKKTNLTNSEISKIISQQINKELV